MPEDLHLGLVGEPPLRGAAQPRRGLGALGDQGERHQPLRPVRPVDEPRRDLPGPVPGAQRRAGDAGVGGGPLQRYPVRPLEPGRQVELKLPVIEPVLPVHGYRSPPLTSA